jgi:phosphate transport system substrate-binding protein
MLSRPSTCSNRKTLPKRTGGLRRFGGAGVLLAIAVPALVLAACSSSSSPTTSASTSTTASKASSSSSLSSLQTPPSGTVALTETGSTLLYPLFNLWAPAYNHQYSNITISTAGTGSGTGISQATAGTVNIGASDAYLSTADVSKTPDLMNVPLAISSQMVNYNIPGFTGTLKLNGKILSDIYQGTITKWNASQIKDINPGVTIPDVTIVPIHRADSSGDTFLFTTYLSDQDPSGWGTKISYGTTVPWPTVPGALGETGNGGMVSGCGATAGCVAYIGVSYRNQANSAHLGEAELENGSGKYVPLNSTTVAAEAASYSGHTPSNGAVSLINSTTAPDGYPIINYEYAIVLSSQPSSSTGQAIKAFLAWAIDPSHGSSNAYLGQVNFLALPSSAVTVSENLIKKIS